MGILTDKSGDKSSKRTMAMASGSTAIILSIVVVLIGLFKDVSNTSLIITLITTNFTTALICLGLTLPEWFSPKANKKE